MISYDVRLSRKQIVKIHANVSVEAQSEQEAVAKALGAVARGEAQWTEPLGAPHENGEIAVEEVIAIVDHDYAEENLDP
jgi:hypothetical protein